MKYKEKWKDIKDFSEKYEVSNYGKIRNKITNHIYKNTNKKGGYFRLNLYFKNRKRTCLIHREVAQAFIPNPNNLPQVNHKDLNKQNNKVNNLEWCTRSENTIHAIKNGANTMKGFNNYNKNKFHKKYGLIIQCDKNKNEINKFYSLKEAFEETGVCTRNILQCINHEPKRKTAGGYIWLSEKEVMSSEIRNN